MSTSRGAIPKRSKCFIQNANSTRFGRSKDDISATVEVIREPRHTSEVLKSFDNLQLVPSCSYEKKCSKYGQPEINSTLRFAEAIMEVQKMTEPKQMKVGMQDLTPYERKMVQAKVSETVNIPQEVKVFNNLISLEVNEDEVTQALSIRPIKRNKPLKRDIEPQLSDYFVPKAKGEYRIIADIPDVKQTNIRSFNGLALHKKIQSWNSTDS